MAQEKSPNRLHVAGTVAFYLVAALSMVMANKWVLNVTTAPLFFLFAQLVVAVLLFLTSHVLNIVKLSMKFDLPLIKGLMPLVLLNVIGLSANNYTLKYVDASFYQVARGLVLPLTVLTSYVHLQTRPSLRILLSCAIVTAGFFVGVFLDHTKVSALGIAFGVASSLMTALHAVATKSGLDIVDGSALDLSWYSNLLSAVVLMPCICLVGEAPAVWDIVTGNSVGLGTFVAGSAITGAIGFLMSISSILSIKVTSPITHMISSAVRGVAASFLGLWLFGDVLSPGRIAAIAIILVGSLVYTWVKHIEAAPAMESNEGYEPVSLEDAEEGLANKEGVPDMVQVR
ncbi:hypothetical protein BV25DRAFT_1917783 [Artomyces pyxidatus]|uniref:Uncharacterized protein n=1 Tax=Artomyces pyxidatus TaxID=48021 RepID=A0ACB8SX78_9AGAM|nr:hypothetical protein BV25DRAFT_1917783 [Artomyces pyxidatus]